MAEEDFDWGSDEKPNEAESYRALLRAVERAKGFNLQFVRCTPIKAKELIEKLKADLPQRKTDLLIVDAETENLYEQIVVLSEKQTADILFVQGLEDPMLAYEQRQGKDILELSRGQGYGGQGWENVPLILGNLNLSREKLRDQFPITLIFFLPDFALNYFIRRAPDFYDWRSNIFDFPTQPEQVNSEYQRIYFDKNRKSRIEKYKDFSSKERVLKITEIISYLDEIQEEKKRADLWFEKGLIHSVGQELEEAIFSYDKALNLNPNCYEAWNNRGNTLNKLGRKEEAIISYDKTLQINPDYHYAWRNRGYVLNNLGKKEEAIISYDKALKIKPNYHEAWNSRGIALMSLGRYKEAIASYDKALDIEPDMHEAWYSRGYALSNLGREEEAISSYDKALEINSNYASAYYNKACLSALQTKIETALESLTKAIELDPKYQEMAKTDNDFDSIRNDLRFQSLIQKEE